MLSIIQADTNRSIRVEDCQFFKFRNLGDYDISEDNEALQRKLSTISETFDSYS